MPYLDTETEAYITRYSDMKTGAKPKPDCPYSQFKRMSDLEEAYCSSGSIHVPRSLDQSYYIGLDTREESAEQDKDQVIYKHAKNQANSPANNRAVKDSESKSKLLPKTTGTVDITNKTSVDHPKLEQHVGHAKILMVNQLWLWQLDKSMLIFHYQVWCCI
jgi:hypothetical protein